MDTPIELYIIYAIAVTILFLIIAWIRYKNKRPKDCRDCAFYECSPPEPSNPYGDEFCVYCLFELAGDYTVCRDFKERD